MKALYNRKDYRSRPSLPVSRFFRRFACGKTYRQQKIVAAATLRPSALKKFLWRIFNSEVQHLIRYSTSQINIAVFRVHFICLVRHCHTFLVNARMNHATVRIFLPQTKTILYPLSTPCMVAEEKPRIGPIAPRSKDGLHVSANSWAYP